MMLPIKPEGAVELNFVKLEANSSARPSPYCGARSPSHDVLRSPSARWEDDPISVEDIAPTPKAPKEPPFQFIENIQPFAIATQSSEFLKGVMQEVRLLSNDAFEEDALSMVSRKSGWRMTLLTRPEGFQDTSSTRLEGFCLDGDDGDGPCPSLIGFLVYRLRPDLDCVSIAKLAIVPEHRQQGHGRRLIEWCIKSAKKQNNVAFVSLSSLPEAVKFYQHIGFRPENVKIEDTARAQCGPDEGLVEGQVYMEYRIKGRSKAKKGR